MASTAQFPPYPLDGELYSGRGQFEQISATVRSVCFRLARYPPARFRCTQGAGQSLPTFGSHNAVVENASERADYHHPANRSAQSAARDGLLKQIEAQGGRMRDAASARIPLQRRQEQPIIEAAKPIRRQMHRNAAL